MPDPVDFFTQLHNAIWAALEAYTPLTSLVAVRNRVKMTDPEFESFPENVSDGGTPEIVVIQGGFNQSAFSTKDGGCGRSQSFTVLITSGRLSPLQMNPVKEAVLDALLWKGPTLGLSQPVNGNKVVGWSVAGDDVLLADATAAPGEDRTGQLRSQSIARVSVAILKALPTRPTL